MKSEIGGANGKEKSRPRYTRGRLSGETVGIGLWTDCVQSSKAHLTARRPNRNPNNQSVRRSGLSHLTVIRTHILLITSFPALTRIIKYKCRGVNYFLCETENLTVAPKQARSKHRRSGIFIVLELTRGTSSVGATCSHQLGYLSS